MTESTTLPEPMDTPVDDDLVHLFQWTSAYRPRDYIGLGNERPSQVVSAVIDFLRSGTPIGEPTPKDMRCPICNTTVGKRHRSDGTLVWGPESDHLIAVHRVWSDEHEWLADRIVGGRETPHVAPKGPPDGLSREARLKTSHRLTATRNNGSNDTDPWDTVPDDADLDTQGLLRAVGVEQPEILPLSIPPKPRRRRHSAIESHRPAPTAPSPGLPEAPFGATLMPTYTDPVQAIAGAYGIDTSLARAIVDVAGRLGAHPFDLANLIGFESAYSFTANVRNPYSGATGLIQFMPRTAQRMGTTTDALAQLSPLDQMQWVEHYFNLVKTGQWEGPPGPLDTLQALALAVFYPLYRYVPTHEPFPSIVAQHNPGIHTPAHYLAAMMKRARLPSGSKAPPLGAPGAPGSAVAAEPTRAPSSGQTLSERLSGWWDRFWEQPVARTPSTPSAAPSALSSMTAPASPPGSVTPQLAPPPQWSSSLGLQVRLADAHGQLHGPGSVPAGRYQIVYWNGQSWIPIATQDLQDGTAYRLYANQGRMQWAPTAVAAHR